VGIRATAQNGDAVAKRRGSIAYSGPKPGRPSVTALMRGADTGYSTAFDLLRRPWRIGRLDLGTLERVARFYGCHPAELLIWDADAPARQRPVPQTNPLHDWPLTMVERLRGLRPVVTTGAGPWPVGMLDLDDAD
jgi:hypothetical protein